MTDKLLKEEILINVTPGEVRAALIEDGVLQEVTIERATRGGLINNIYQGKVSRVLPGMQAAFIEIGLDRTAFLHINDISRVTDKGNGEIKGRVQDIRELVREGQDILVQVVKDPIGTKGARLTTFITLPSRFLVLLPMASGVRISARIVDEEERKRLSNELRSIAENTSISYGIIVRTAAEGVTPDALSADLHFLCKLWSTIQAESSEASAKTLVHQDLPLPVRMLRDMVTDHVERILVDSEADFERLQKFTENFLPDLTPILGIYKGRRPIFDLHGTEDEIKKALAKSISLKSGGHVIIDQTEAMTTIDVNTGGYLGHRNLEETVYRTNLEAAVIIARQLRLRNLGGLIIIDFIDMDEPEHRDRVLEVLEQSMLSDHAHHHITPVSPLGLVEMTRKRTRESLQHVLCEDCDQCDGRGFTVTAETVCFEIFRELLRQHQKLQSKEVLVLAHQDIIELLLGEEAAGLAELEERIGKSIRLRPESLYLKDQFDVVLM